MIKVIAFDYGGVLGTEADAWETTFKNVLVKGRLTLEYINKIWEENWPKLKVGKEDIGEFWKGNENLREIYNDSITIDSEMLNFAKSLKHKYKLVILSNDSKDWMNAKINKFKLLDVFDKVYTSANIGIAKPDKRIFEFVLKDLNIMPEEMLFIDNQENNIETAKLLGIKTILFSNQSHTVAHIKKSYKDVIGNIE